MQEYKIVKLSNGYTKIKKTKKENAICLICNKKIFSWSASVGFEGVTCTLCGGKGEW